MSNGKAQFIQHNPKPEDLGAQIFAMHLLLMALMQTHPAKEALRASFKGLSEYFVGDLLTKMVPESYIEEVRANIMALEAVLS